MCLERWKIYHGDSLQSTFAILFVRLINLIVEGTDLWFPRSW